jgi:hypothetical protein
VSFDFESLDSNLVESLREGVRWQRGARLVESDGLLLALGSTRFPVGLSNGVMRLDRALPAEDALERALGYFAAEGQGRAFTLWVRGDPDADLLELAQAEKLTQLSELPSPWMLLRRPLPEVPTPAGVELLRVRDEAELRELVEVARQAWAPVGLPPDETAALLARPDRMLAPHLIWYLARVDGRGAAAAMAICSHGVAGIYWVSTVPTARRRGLGDLVTRAAGNAGFEAGMRVAALQASQMGFPVYRRMGYETVAWTRWFIARPPRRS